MSEANSAMLTRLEHASYRQLESLCQKAGCPRESMRRMVVKEAVDNALDVGPTTLTRDEDGTYIIENEGCSLPEMPEDIAALYSFGRPQTSSKFWRKPSRGALGNGNRVIAGAAISSGGRLAVTCRGKRYELQPQDDGTTSVIGVTDAPEVAGTRVEIWLGPSLPEDDDDLSWGEDAIRFATGGTAYRGKSSGHFFDDDSFFELCQSAEMHVRPFVAEFDGCTGAKAGRIADAFKGRLVNTLTRDETHSLLAAIRLASKPVKPKRLGLIGNQHPLMPQAYGRADGWIQLSAGRGGLAATIPFRVEAWATKMAGADSYASCLVNRTPAAVEIRAWTKLNKGKNVLWLLGPNDLYFGVHAGKSGYDITIHVSTPYMPITSDGKEPNLKLLQRQISQAVEKAVRIARRTTGGDRVGDAKARMKDCILRHLAEGIALASGDGATRFSQRQLFYSLRPFLLSELGIEPSWSWFCKILTDFEGWENPIAGMTRDNRGSVYLPHEGIEIPLGTVTVENYTHRKHLINNVLYCEKEGLVAVLREAKWPERYDCAVLSAKGMANRAARDLIDILGDTGEPLKFFCIHDGDSAGTLIYEKLQFATPARAARKVEIINLGLEPWEGLAMGLQVETFKPKGKRRPTADYVKERSFDHIEEPKWDDWLQTQRIELNAMTGPQFLAWLDGKMKQYRVTKVLPATPVLHSSLQESIRAEVEKQLTDEAVRKANVTARTTEIMAGLSPDLAALSGNLRRRVGNGLKNAPSESWRHPLGQIAAKLAGKALKGRV